MSFNPYMYCLEKKLQQNFTAPWIKKDLPKQAPAEQKLILQYCDKLQYSLLEYNKEPNAQNLTKLVVYCKQLELLGYHPAIFGEGKRGSGVIVIRQDIWMAIQAQREKEDSQNVNVPSPNAG